MLSKEFSGRFNLNNSKSVDRLEDIQAGMQGPQWIHGTLSRELRRVNFRVRLMQHCHKLQYRGILTHIKNKHGENGTDLKVT